jgi:signal transduction histidine kinase
MRDFTTPAEQFRGVIVKDVTRLATQIRTTFHTSSEAVRRAHERATEASERARRMRAEMRQRREITGQPESTHDTLRLVEEASARAVRESERFIAVVSHELRQPLNAAVGAMSLLEANASPAATERARVVLRRQLLHLSTLLDDLLDMSRLTLRTLRVQRSPIDLRMVIEDALDTVEAAADTAGINIESTLPPSGVTVLGDPSRLQQALSNLLSNAIRYTPRDGHVSIAMTVDGGMVEVTVADTGQGIAPSDLTNIFEPFWRGRNTGSEGFGIGLALVKGIIELHGGSISAHSAGLGQGARFRLMLPISSAE